MRSVRFLLMILALGCLLQGWGFDTHRRINRAAVGMVGGPFGKFLAANGDTLSAHAIDPDVWRQTNPEEGVRHYLDADYFSKDPLKDLPRTFAAAQSKYGGKAMKEWGTAPWYIGTLMDSLTGLFKQNKWDQSVFLMAAMGHYIADIHMPLHTVINYNGQFTGNDGVHYRWESQLVDRYIKTIGATMPPRVLTNPREEPFIVIGESYAVHQQILDADTYARRNLTPTQKDTLATYEDGVFLESYLSDLYLKSADLLQSRLDRAAWRVASIWLTCWDAAGRPNPPAGHD